MLSQEQVEIAMNSINRPCTIKDILEWFVNNNLINKLEGDQTHHPHATRNRIANRIQHLRKWKVVDRLPQGHTINGLPIFYLTKNGDPHVTPCKICHERDAAYSKHANRLMSKYFQRRYVHQTAMQGKYISEEL